MKHPINLVWPTDSRYVTQHFGLNAEFYQQFGLPAHEGIDLRALKGANLYALADGEVTKVENPPNHPYGLHIRMTHQQNGVTFESIYAHLDDANVQAGQTVKAGQLIGLADDSGNSFGSHLHLTLKIVGEQTGAFPPGVVDPWPYLKDAPGAQDLPVELPPKSDLTVYTTVELSLRAQPTTESARLGVLGVAEPLTVLGAAAEAEAKLGIDGAWIQVQTQSNMVGYVAAWFVEVRDESAKPSGIIVYPITKINVRAAGSMEAAIRGTIDIGDGVMVIGAEERVSPLIGQSGEWLSIEADSGVRGYVAAEAVRRAGELPPLTELTLYPTDILSVRAKPTTASNRLTLVTQSDPLTVMGESLEDARRKVGQAGAWLQVTIPTGQMGFVSAEYVQSAQDASFGEPTEIDYLGVSSQNEVSLYPMPTAEDSIALTTLPANTELDVLDTDLEVAAAKVGQVGEWLFVATAEDERGWVMTDSLQLVG